MSSAWRRKILQDIPHGWRNVEKTLYHLKVFVQRLERIVKSRPLFPKTAAKACASLGCCPWRVFMVADGLSA